MGNRKFIWSGIKTLQKQLADIASYNNIGRPKFYFSVESYAYVHNYLCMPYMVFRHSKVVALVSNLCGQPGTEVFIFDIKTTEFKLFGKPESP